MKRLSWLPNDWNAIHTVIIKNKNPSSSTLNHSGFVCCFKYMDAFTDNYLLRLPFFMQSVLTNRLQNNFWFIFQRSLALHAFRIDEIQNKDTSFWRNSIKQLCCPLFFISWRYALRTRFYGLTLDLFESYDSQLSRTAHSVLASSKYSRATVQVPRKSTAFHLLGSSCCTFLCFILGVPRIRH